VIYVFIINYVKRNIISHQQLVFVFIACTDNATILHDVAERTGGFVLRIACEHSNGGIGTVPLKGHMIIASHHSAPNLHFVG